MINKKLLIEGLGWIGALITLIAFSLNSLNRIDSQSAEYLLMNVVGCAFLIVYTYHKKAYANSILNTIWLLMSLVATISVFAL